LRWVWRIPSEVFSSRRGPAVRFRAGGRATHPEGSHHPEGTLDKRDDGGGNTESTSVSEETADPKSHAPAR